MKLKFFALFATGAIAESLVSGKAMVGCGDDMCMKSSRTDGTLICAEVDQDAINSFNLEMWYDAGTQCISTNMYKWFAANGRLFRIKGNEKLQKNGKVKKKNEGKNPG